MAERSLQSCVLVERSAHDIMLRNGRGWGYGQLSDTGYITWDRAGNLITGATGQDRVTVWIKPKR